MVERTSSAAAKTPKTAERVTKRRVAGRFGARESCASESGPGYNTRVRSRAISLLLALLALASLGFEWEGRLIRLRRDLESGDPARRREVVRMLASYSADEVREPLLLALEDSDAGVRAEAAEAAGAVRLREAVPRLLDWLDDPEADVRASAARALGRIGEERAVSSLVRALGDTSADVRNAAVQALAAIGTADVVVPVLGRLDDVDSTVRVAAAEALGQLRDPRSVVPLVGRARDDAPEVRVAVYDALGDIGEARALPALLQGLRDDSETAQLSAIAAVGRLGDDSAIEPLMAIARDADPRRARAVVAALGGIGGEAALDAVVESLARHQTRDVAAEVLVSMARGSRRPLVMRSLARALDEAASHLHATAIADVMVRVAIGPAAAPEEQPPHHAEAEQALLRAARVGHGAPAEILKALAVVGSEEVLVPILERVRSDEPAMRQAALEALALYFEKNEADGRAADPLLNALGRVSPEQRILVVRLLGEVGAARALPELRPLLEHEDPALRLAAVQAIGAIGDSEGAGVLLELLDDRDPRTRYEAAHALEAAASPQTIDALVTRLGAREPTDRHAVILALGGALERMSREGPVAHPGALAVLAAAARGADEALAARAIGALGRWGTSAAVEPLVGLLSHPSPPRQRAAAQALGGIEGDRALAALREALGSRELSLVTSAATALGQHGTREDVARLLEVAQNQPWPASAAAAYGLARLARRGLLEPAMHPRLCELARSRDAFVRANVATAMASMSAPPCESGAPATWLGPRHAGSVRAAAARWLAAAAAAGHADPARARRELDACVESDPEAGPVCEDPQMPPLDDVADIYAYSADGRRIRSDDLVALRLADGSVWVGRTDVLGHVRIENAPRGRLLLDDPVSTPLEP